MDKFWIFGAGRNAQKCIRNLKCFLDIEYILDNDINKRGKKIEGIEINSSEILKSEKYIGQKIIISVTNREVLQSIFNELDKIGLHKGSDYFEAVNIVNMFSDRIGVLSGPKPEINGYVWSKGIDAKSRLLISKSEKRIYRVVEQQYYAQYFNVFSVCKQSGILGKDIVGTLLSNDFKELKNELVLEHDFIEPISYCYEWNPKMFKDYVLFMLQLILKLTQLNLGLEDGHALNVTFYQGRFMLVDFGALNDGITKPIILIEMLNTHVLPLILIMKNQIDKAYLFIKNADICYSPLDIIGYINKEELKALLKLYEMAVLCNTKEDIICLLGNIREYIDNFDVVTQKTRWDGYQDDEWEKSDDKTLWSSKMVNVIAALEKLRPKTVIDLAGNMGWYGSYLREKLDYAIIVDVDTTCLGVLWDKIKDNKMVNIVPVYMSLCAPSLDYYKDYPIANSSITAWRKSAIARFKSDVVIALAIVHHLAFSQQLSFKEIIGQFELFSNKYLIVEFIDKKDYYIRDFSKQGFDWYTKENFERELKKRFEILDIKTSTPSETRWIYIAQKVQ